MRLNYLLLGLVALTMAVGFYMSGRTGEGDNVAAPQVGFTGDAREIAMTVLALGIGGFVAYLAVTRR